MGTHIDRWRRGGSVLLLGFALGWGFVYGSAAAAPCPPPPARPIIVDFLGFNELPGGGSHQLALEVADRLNAEFLGPYIQAQNPRDELTSAVANVLHFEAQPLKEVKQLLKAAVEAGVAVVDLVGAPVIAPLESYRARNDLQAALASDPTRPVYVFAYSWGTVSARLLLPDLLKQGTVVAKVILLDPVHVLQPELDLSIAKVFDLNNKRLTISGPLSDKTTTIFQKADPFIHGDLVIGVPTENQHNLSAELSALYPECANSLVACLHERLPTAPPVLDIVTGLLPPAAPPCCGNDRVEGTEQCDGTNASACQGRSCIAAGQTNECQCKPPDLSGTWTTCMQSYTTPPSVATVRCYPCPCPPDSPPGTTGCGGSCTNGGWGAEALPLPFCFALGFFGPQAIHVTQSGTSLSGSVTTASCSTPLTCIDTLTGSISGNTVSVVRTLTISNSDPPATQVMTYNIEGTLIPPASIVGSTFSGNIISHVDFECSTYDESGSLGTGTASVSISPGP